MSEVWSAIMVRDVIYSMAEFAARKCENWDDNEDWDYITENPEITDAEMEQIVPGITQQVTKTVATHTPSDQMYLAIYAQARELAQTAVNEMDPEDIAALINAARKKVHRARARTRERANDKTKYLRSSGGRPPAVGMTPAHRRSKTQKEQKMSEAMNIQKPTSKAGETESLPDIPHYYREYLTKDNWYCLMAQLFHMPSVLDSLPENWCLLIKANRAHMMIMLREAGAGHDPFGDAEWSSTPAQVWENLAKVEQLPNLEGADLSGIDFKWADLDEADLKGANLSGANLSWASLQLTDLTGANLTGADLRWATLDGADLTGANLTGTDLRWTVLPDADLPGADLRGATIDGTILVDADLTGANLTGVNLRSAHLYDTKLDGAIGLD